METRTVRLQCPQQTQKDCLVTNLGHHLGKSIKETRRKGGAWVMRKLFFKKEVPKHREMLKDSVANVMKHLEEVSLSQ